MKITDVYFISLMLFVFGVIEALMGVYINSKRTKEDWIADIIGVVWLGVFVRPFVAFAAAAILSWVLPEAQGKLSFIPLWAGFLLVFLPDDFLHYWYHRLSHRYIWLWKIHRAHHSPTELNIAMAYRDNWLWFLMGPNLWYSASMAYFGLGEAYILSTAFIGTMNIFNHSSFKWEQAMEKYKFFRPLLWLIRRVFTLPSTHHVHHGIDEASAPMRNYAPTFFLWDVIFKTAHFPTQYPKKYGLMSDLNEPWYVYFGWPLFGSAKSGTKALPEPVKEST